VDQRKFYAELGHLLYALAAVDGRVQAQEIETMKRVVAEQLVPQEASKDHFGTDRAFITEFEFDVLVERGDPPEEAFGSFLTYFGQHKARITQEQKLLILRAAEVVAHAFHGVNAKELSMLAELERKIR